MLDTKSGIEVTIKPTEAGIPFAEYAPKPKKRGNHNDAYIEAVTDQVFGIFIRLGPDFDPKGCTHVKLALTMDNLHISWTSPRLVKGRGRDDWINSTTRHDIHMTNEEEDAEIDKRGKILVTVTRGSSICRNYPGVAPQGTPDMNMRTSKKVAVDKGKSHSLKSVDLGPASISTRTWVFKEATGPKGKGIEFKFLYASRAILELKKIIPPAISPPAAETPAPAAVNTPPASPALTQQATEIPVTPDLATSLVDGVRVDMSADLPNHSTTLDKLPPNPDAQPKTRPRAAAPSVPRTKGKQTQICLDHENNTRSTCPEDEDDEEITPNPAQKCPDQDDEELTIVGSREMGSTGLKREAGDVIDFTADAPAVKKVKREVIDLCSDELEDRKVKMEVGGFMGRSASSVAGFGRVKSEFSGGWGGRVKERARLRLELEGLDIKAEQNLVRRRLMELKSTFERFSSRLPISLLILRIDLVRMFDIASGIEVLVKPHGSNDAYDEVKAKTASPLYAHGRNECYIEAETGKRFVVEVVLHPIFRWISRRVAVTYNTDLISDWDSVERPPDGQAAISTCTQFITRVNGIRTVCAFEFGEAHMHDDPTCLSGDQEEIELHKRGKIEVLVQRVYAAKNDKASRKAKKDHL
ncbi:hypothetical protein LTR97_004109 [Elasticomyces elasticus]|uniref:DUF7918 domain-containing protein n=1 Tax=Elasticomyces elasticus TaxID=574655 RepID=A0AAN8A404_9PEZI|nr:hypothetical protein LTR97_004109 [Elasticomyces elasticus]